MKKDIDIKNRIVNLYDVNTKNFEQEIIEYLDKQMKVRFHSVLFNNSKYIFTGTPIDQDSKSITVNGYREKANNENISVIIE